MVEGKRVVKMNTTDGALVTDLTGDLRSAEKSIILTSGRQEARAAETSLRKIVVAMPFGRTALEKEEGYSEFQTPQIYHRREVSGDPLSHDGNACCLRRGCGEDHN